MIFKEAITNIAKHSKANKVELNVDQNGELLKITLKDNGQGFNEDLLDRKNGLNNMKSRAKKIECDLEILSDSSSTVISLIGNLPKKGGLE